MVMGDFFLNGYKEEYPNCKFPTFNSGKTIERQVERGLHEQYLFDEVRRPLSGSVHLVGTDVSVVVDVVIFDRVSDEGVFTSVWSSVFI
jgi:hypothetical protein